MLKYFNKLFRKYSRSKDLTLTKYQQKLIPIFPEGVQPAPQSKNNHSLEEIELRNQQDLSEATLHHSENSAMKNFLKKERASLQSLDLLELNKYRTVTLAREPEESSISWEFSQTQNFQSSTSSVSGDHNREGCDDSDILDADLLQKQEKTAQIYLEQALSFCEGEKWSQAFEYCKQALTMNPNSVEADQLWNRMLHQKTEVLQSPTLATVRSQNIPPSNRLELAINRYRYQAQLYPDSAVVQTNLGKLYHKNQQWQEAIACYQNAITIDSDYALAHQYLAQAINRKNHSSGAEVKTSRNQSAKIQH